MTCSSTGTAQLGETSAHLLIGSEAEQALDYSDPDRLGGAAASQLTIVVPREAILEIRLPKMPRTARELRTALKKCAPLVLEDLVWTGPIPGQAPADTYVRLVRRDWLDPRLAAVRNAVVSARWVIVDADGVGFAHRSEPGRRGVLAISAVLAVLAIFAIVGWQATHLIQNAPTPANRKSIPTADAPLKAPEPASPSASASPGEKTGLVLLGIAGRLPDDADVLMKTPWGKTATMRMGDSLLGWKLVGVAPDRVTLEKDGSRDQLVLEPLP